MYFTLITLQYRVLDSTHKTRCFSEKAPFLTKTSLLAHKHTLHLGQSGPSLSVLLLLSQLWPSFNTHTTAQHSDYPAVTTSLAARLHVHLLCTVHLGRYQAAFTSFPMLPILHSAGCCTASDSASLRMLSPHEMQDLNKTQD